MPRTTGNAFHTDSLDHVFPDTPKEACSKKSLYEADAIEAVSTHTEYFARGIYFRNNSSLGWSVAAAVCHKEKIESRKDGHGVKKVITREIYTDKSQIPSRKLYAEVKIDETIYTVEAYTDRSAGRVCLHLIRVSPTEATNPNHRGR